MTPPLTPRTTKETRVPGTLSTIWTIAALTLTRVLRGWTLWVGTLIALLPIPFAAALRAYGRPVYGMLQDIMRVEQVLIALLVALFVGASIGEDIEDRTTTYLWSRPVQRWAVLAGKLLTLIPVVIALVLASWTISLQAGPQLAPSVISCVALAAGITGVSLVAAAIATIVPKHGMALTISYSVVDIVLGALPGTFSKLSISHHVRMVADVADRHDESAMIAGIGIAAIGGVWLVIALLRTRRLEA